MTRYINPYACAPPILLQDAYDILVQARVASPFALEWVQPGVPTEDAEIGSTSSLNSPRAIIRAAGGEIHPGNNPGDPRQMCAGQWHHISISVQEEAIAQLDEFFESIPIQAKSRGNTSSILKARIELGMGNARIRRFDFDIGAGVEFSVKAQYVNRIWVLVPLPSSIPAGAPNITESLATSLVTSVYCGQSGRGNRNHLSYSQVFFGVSAEGGIVTMPVVADAREVEVFFQDTSVAAGDLAVEFDYVRGSPIVPQFGSPPFSITKVGTQTVAVGQSSTTRVTIPGNANTITVINNLGVEVTANVVQILNV